jgi:hypothetical protein
MAMLTVPVIVIAAAVAFAGVSAVRQWALDRLPELDLDQSDAWFLDWRLAALRDRPDLCRRVLKPPHIVASPIEDQPPQKGCGWANAVRVVSAGGAHAGFDKITCEAAAALALWVEHGVQPLAHELLGRSVTALESMGSYACRNMAGNPLWLARRSEHASANALDVAGFRLGDGRRISVAHDWRSQGVEGRFLRAVHARACRYFRVVLGPDYNSAHHDHFHLDRGLFWSCL